jgi:hypothetical protein
MSFQGAKSKTHEGDCPASHTVSSKSSFCGGHFYAPGMASTSLHRQSAVFSLPVKFFFAVSKIVGHSDASRFTECACQGSSPVTTESGPETHNEGDGAENLGSQGEVQRCSFAFPGDGVPDIESRCTASCPVSTYYSGLRVSLSLAFV